MKFSSRREMYSFMRDNGLPMSDFIYFGDINGVISEIEKQRSEGAALIFLSTEW